MTHEVRGRLVLEDRVIRGRLVIEDDRIDVVEVDSVDGPQMADDGSLVLAGFVDVHIHGWGGHDAMGGRAALDGMSRSLLRHGVTSFLPTAVTASLDDLARFAATVRDWVPAAPTDGARPLGANIEGPFISDAKRGAQDPALLRSRVDVPPEALESLASGLRIMTVAPEVPGALELIGWLAGRGIAVSLGHSAATADEGRAGYAAGARTTTHLFNGMTGIDHRAPGLALAALTQDAAYVELIADGRHVHPAVWDLVVRAKPPDRIMLVSDALPMSGTGPGRSMLGALAIDIHEDRATLAGSETLAGSVLALDGMVRNVIRAGLPIHLASAAASANPASLLGLTDRGRLAPGLLADLVVMDPDLQVQRVMRGGVWV